MTPEQTKRWRPVGQFAEPGCSLWACYTAQGQPVGALAHNPATEEFAVRAEAPAGKQPSRIILKSYGGKLDEEFDDADASIKDLGWKFNEDGTLSAV